MAILGASFQIGRSALAAYQAAIAITGQNIANVGNPDYARQTGRLTALYGGMTLTGIAPGTGVSLSGLQRHIDEAVETRLRLALGQRSGAAALHENLSRIETLYGELSDTDLSTQLSELFGSLANLQTDPSDSAARRLVIARADAVVQTFQRQRTGLLDQISDLNRAVEDLTRTANGIVGEIAELNGLIVAQEAGGQTGAGALRDRRDALLRELAELMDIQTRADENGVVNVYIGSEPLVDFDRSRGLTTEKVLAGGLERVSVRFADTRGNVVMRTGRLAALVQARDTHVQNQLDQLDRLAGALIYEVNRVHTSGCGLVGYTAIIGSTAARDAGAALNSSAAGLPFPVQNGTLLVRVRDAQSGQTITRQIEIDLDGLGGDDTTLADLAGLLNGVPGLDAKLTIDNRLQLQTAAGYEVSFAEDTSGVLAALGVATFFEGTNATTLAVRAAVRADPRLIATSASGAPGDGTNAGRLAQVWGTASALLGGQSLAAFHEGMINGLAVDTAAAETAHLAADAVYSSMRAQRESVSGVSLDEEALNLMKFERAFQGAARFLNVLDSLSGEILSLVS